MSAWVLRCRNCNAELERSPIKALSLLDYLQPLKPELPIERSQFECPNCGHREIYYVKDFVYRA
jgi:DNA-directed RNA polymerase subunit RPC12/RpoP